MGHCPDCQVVKMCSLKLVEFFCVSVYHYVWYFSLLEISFPLFAMERCSLSFKALFQCYSSLKFFLFFFPGVINSLIFSVPQNFTPILLQHGHCFPVRFLSTFPVHPPSSWADGLYLTHFRSSLADTASSLS